ncbi:hypothetical protein L6164_016733 [Bauhinia variegata]|uniref:Uncharacterized protein n=1 Tax=Bauhinia variegata TaxID=167791 RepID=A0ACB9N5M7_BAUVA|nr:hypothetical protein L6164_016733 [Bauhinia variegata]
MAISIEEDKNDRKEAIRAKEIALFLDSNKTFEGWSKKRTEETKEEDEGHEDVEFMEKNKEIEAKETIESSLNNFTHLSHNTPMLEEIFVETDEDPTILIVFGRSLLVIVMRIGEEKIWFSMVDNKELNKIDESCMIANTNGKDKLSDQRKVENDTKGEMEENALTNEPTQHEIIEEILMENPSMRKFEEYDKTRIPQKGKDHGRFYVLCKIEECCFEEVPLDTGASVNVMSLEIFHSLGYSLEQDSSMTIFMADNRSIKTKGSISNVIVKTANHPIPVDFMMLEIEAGNDTPLILGRPFLYTNKANMDMEIGRLALRIGRKEICFQMPYFKKEDHIFYKQIKEEPLDEVKQLWLHHPSKNESASFFIFEPP